MFCVIEILCLLNILHCIMGDKQPVNVNNLSSLNHGVQNDGDLPILKDVHNNNGHTFNKDALDEYAEELFFSLFEGHEEIVKAKFEIHRLEQKLQALQRNNKIIEAEINICCFDAKKFQETQNYNSFLNERNVGVQYPPKYTIQPNIYKFKST